MFHNIFLRELFNLKGSLCIYYGFWVCVVKGFPSVGMPVSLHPYVCLVIFLWNFIFPILVCFCLSFFYFIIIFLVSVFYQETESVGLDEKMVDMIIEDLRDVKIVIRIHCMGKIFIFNKKEKENHELYK